MPRIDLGEEEIEYKVRISSEASKCRLDMKLDETVVVLPENADISPEQFLREKKQWLLEKKQKFDEYRERIPERNFEQGEKFPYLNDSHTLEIAGQSNRIEDQQIILSEPSVDRKGIKEVLEEFYRSKARRIFEEKVDKHIENIDGEFNKIYIRNQKTKWASCSPKDNLSFNWRLIMAPEDVIEYVVVHELVHLEEKNHDAKFWKRVREIKPDYKESYNWLSENSPKLVFTEEDIK
jgi:predicted metal-dependent hydrolase